MAERTILVIARITCPALIFAASRNASVMGRMRDLIISIRVRNGIRGGGVLLGNMWAFNKRKLANVLSIIVVHKVNERVRVIIRWEVMEIKIGANPSRFRVEIDQKMVEINSHVDGI